MTKPKPKPKSSPRCATLTPITTRTWPCTRHTTDGSYGLSSRRGRGSARTRRRSSGCSAERLRATSTPSRERCGRARTPTRPTRWTGEGPRYTTRASPGNGRWRRCSWSTAPILVRWTVGDRRRRTRACPGARTSGAR